MKFRDAIGRLWQGPTIQLDFSLPERFELEYTGADNKPHRPVMIHRAIYGTLERFIGALIEHLAGAFPTWLAPEQVRVISITDAQRDAAAEATRRMTEAGIRVHLDDRSETLKYKIAEGMRLKIPYLAVIGKREAEQGTIAVSVRGAGEKQHPMPVPVDEFIARVREEIASRALELRAGAPAA